MPTSRRAGALLALLAVLHASAATGGALPACPRDDGVPPLRGAIRGVHDPAVARDAGAFFLFATGPGIPLRRSNDLRRWTSAGTVFPGAVPEWAPGVIPGAIDDATRDGERTLGVRRLAWTRDGWPVVAGGPEQAPFATCPPPLAGHDVP